MRVRAVLNRDGGTLKTTDLSAYTEHLEAEFAGAGHSLDVKIVPGKELIAALEAAASDKEVDAIVAGGGDGTISAAAGIAMKSGKALGVIPAGTMNLFARSLGVPLDITDAAVALASGKVAQVDIASVDERPFIHQFSVGMQPRVVLERERTDYRSRFGKMLASALATLSMLARPPVFRARMSVDGTPVDLEKYSVISISNNPYGEGHLPYADKVDAGILGVYYVPALDGAASLRLAADLTVGAWTANTDFIAGTGKEVRLEFPRLKRSARAVVDGELIGLEPEMTIRIHPGALPVILPAETA